MTHEEQQSSNQDLQVNFYTRRGCHLCDEALAILNHQGIKPEVIDIDEQPELFEQFNTCVPVVEIDGKVRFRGRVDEVLLRRLLHAVRGSR
ncbi:glutaredoxin family protein [Adhaeretor mobilis]|uniref:Glutaredoxin n=1 Tax=Adhaeretor mobilis TaxID=1930276 RepID=A0A517MXU6_9BACT|nr:glutaredoxin family protein [Adhaeretor mobilis]QDS99700.1 Glutaredoxin [Adhaeretor mobilis]